MRQLNTSILRKLVLGVGLALPLSVFAAPGYWTDSYGQVWRTGTGQCWHTSYWTKNDATSQCDANLLPKPKPTPIVQTIQAPAPAFQSKIITLNETARGAATFGSGQWALTRAQSAKLGKAFDHINAKDIQRVKITGYTDPTGPLTYNMKLSKKRAEAAAEYIEKHFDVPSNKVVVVGKGPANLVVNCKGMHGHVALAKCYAPDRRVVVEIDFPIKKTAMTGQSSS